MQFITILDYALLPFVFALVYGIAYTNRNRRYPHGHPWRKYYMPALSVKIFGAIFISLIYAYYYKGGDTFNYFFNARLINSSFDESFTKWVNLLFHIPDPTDGKYYNYISQMSLYRDPPSYTVASITAFFSLFTLNTYLPTAVLFAFISFSGLWALFRTFASLYPQFIRPIAIAILFIPSVFVWGSGIFKDTVCIFGLGWLTYGAFRLMVQRDYRLSNIILTTLSFILIAKIKIYILLGFVPALLMWILFAYSQKIKTRAQKLLIRFFFIAIIAAGFLFFFRRFGNELGRYSLEKIARTSEVTRNYIYYVSSEEGSAYNLGDFSPTIGGMLSQFPLAVNVTFFRPYPWEAKKLIVLLSAIEALIFFFLTLKVIVSVGIRKVWKTINADPTIQFCLIFSLIFAFSVGVSSYNFGTLSRYKIPCLPFYALTLILIYYKNNKPKNSLFGPLKI